MAQDFQDLGDVKGKSSWEAALEVEVLWWRARPRGGSAWAEVSSQKLYGGMVCILMHSRKTKLVHNHVIFINIAVCGLLREGPTV